MSKKPNNMQLSELREKLDQATSRRDALRVGADRVVALDKAAKVNSELAVIEEQEEGNVTRLAWPGPFPEQPLAESRLERWCRFCTSEGYEL